MTTPKAFKLPVLQHNVSSADVSDDLSEMCRALTGRAVRVLVQIMEDDSATVSSRVTAATTILDRAHGKPAQTSVNVTADIAQMHLAALKQHADETKALQDMKDVTL
jgi:ribosomal protein L11